MSEQEVKTCPECKQEFATVKPWQRFDKPRCRIKWNNRKNQRFVEIGRRAVA